MATPEFIDPGIAFPCLCIALLILSLLSTSLYWRAFAVSWLATICLSYYLWSLPRPVSLQSVLISFLNLLLFLWSLFLSPIQLVLAKKEDEESHSDSTILWDPETTGISRKDIKAE